jgi:trimethylamine--corrinoid protein Co-methyltransferase
MAIRGPEGGKLRFISKKQVEMIYENALKVLEEVGILVKSEALLDVFAEAGGAVDSKEQHVFINRKSVNAALEAAPKCVVMSGRDPDRDVVLEGRRVYFTFGGTPNAQIIDFETGEFRPSTIKDVGVVTTLADYFESMTVMMTVVGGYDAPVESHYLHELTALYEHTTKPIIYPAPGAVMSRKALQIATAVAGGEEQMRNRPILSIYTEPTTPLTFTKDEENIIEFAKAGAPIVCGPAAMAGATAPMTLPGNATVGLAENLASLVATQTVKEGAPFILGPHCGVMDMRTMRFCYGAPELHMGWVIQTQLADHLNLPIFGMGGCNDSKSPDAQAGAEAAMSALMAGLCGTNLVHNVATTAMGDAGCLEMIVICDDILGYVLRILKDISVDEEALAFDVIRSVGPGGNYLREMHTFRHFKENYMPKIFDRTNPATWMTRGSKEAREIARQRVEEILKQHHPQPLRDETRREIDKILSA